MNRVGYRYWQVDDDGSLLAPIRGNHRWQPGIAKATCVLHDGWMEDCSCGMYAWPHDEKEICTKEYFDIHTGAVSRHQHYQAASNAVIGAVLLHNPIDRGDNMLRAPSAEIIALTVPKDASKLLRNRATAAAKKYGVAVVSPKELIALARAEAKRQKHQPQYLTPRTPQRPPQLDNGIVVESADFVLKAGEQLRLKRAQGQSKRTLKQWLLRREAVGA